MSGHLKAFISYKWEYESHNTWVAKFATDLRAAGIDAILDRWEVRFGESFTDYMTSKISEADFVLFVMTTQSVMAAEAPSGKGGAVKFEVQLATARRTAGESLRFIGIYREGDRTLTHLRDHRYIDFRDDSLYEERLRELINDLLGHTTKPLLGMSTQMLEDPERILRLRVHRARFINTPTECYFINATNLSPNRVVEITHAWYEDGNHHISVMQPSRRLPKRLELDESWETWIELEKIPEANRATAYQNFRARISTGTVFKSEKNPDVPPYGSVPGGPIQST